jgi:putative acetyltransferase
MAGPLNIRRVTADDAAAMANLMADPAVYGGLMQLPYPTAEMWRTRLAPPANGAPDISLVAERDGQLIASAGLHSASQHLRRRHVLGLGMAVAAHAQGQGVGSALMKALCDYADNWGFILRIELTVYTDNLPAVALYRKFGFQTEGTLRAYALRDGALVDAFFMARLHPRPPAMP